MFSYTDFCKICLQIFCFVVVLSNGNYLLKETFQELNNWSKRCGSKEKIGNFMDVSDGQIWPMKGREKSDYLPWKCKMQAQSEKIVQNCEILILKKWILHCSSRGKRTQSSEVDQKKRTSFSWPFKELISLWSQLEVNFLCPTTIFRLI